MTDFEKVFEIIDKNSGIITTKEVRDNNINTTILTRLVKENLIVRISKGYYSLPNLFIDNYYKLTLNSKNAIYSHDTALYFYDLTDRTPVIFDITVPIGYNGILRKNNNVILHYVKRNVLELGLCMIESPFGMKIKVYDVERTICDIIKNKNKIDSEIFTKALNRYSKSKSKDLNKLMRYAKILKIDKKVRMYMEVLI